MTIEQLIDYCESQLKLWEALYETEKRAYKNCAFWKLKEKKRHYRLANAYCGYMEAFIDVIDKIKPK